MPFTIARVEPTPQGQAAGTQQVSVSGTAVAVLVAVIGIVPPVLTALINLATSPGQTAVQQADAAVKLADAETKKVTSDLDRRRFEDTWLRSALSLEKEEDRAAAIQFLVAAGLVADPGGRVSKALKPPRFGAPTPQLQNQSTSSPPNR